MHPLFISQEVSRFHNVGEVLNIIRSGYFRTKEEPEMNKIFRLSLIFDINSVKSITNTFKILNTQECVILEKRK